MAIEKRKRKKATKKARGTNLEAWLKQKLRRISYQFPERKEAIKKARVARGKYKCALCEGDNFGPKDIQLDHIQPVINPEEGFVDWNTYIDRLFCGVDGWQVCCRDCHETKSFMENQIRVMVKTEKRKEEAKNEEDI